MVLVRTETEHHQSDLLMLAVLSVLVGAATGLLVATFRMTLAAASRWRDEAIAQAHHLHSGGFLLVIAGCSISVIVAAWLVRRFSVYASGSGLPEVEAALTGALPSAPLRRILLIKFVGGLLSIGSGMALGPEGPGVQMGAVSARLIGTVFRRTWPDVKALVVAGAGAGIAVAFNAPIAGAVFALEELVRRFEIRTAIAVLGVSSTAILVSRMLLGDTSVLHLIVPEHATAMTGPLPYAAAATWPLYLALGALAGVMAALYNRLILGSLSITDSLAKWPVEMKAALIGAAIGMIGWFNPQLIGAGDNISQRILSGTNPVSEILLFFAIRFCLGPVSYAARTPGGLFAPLLVVGVLIGTLLGDLCQAVFPALAIEPQAFAVVGMAAFFTGVVRTPITGIALAIEMTAAFSTLLPMIVACFMAMLVATLLRDPPIYDSLRNRLIRELQLTADRKTNSGPQ